MYLNLSISPQIRQKYDFFKYQYVYEALGGAPTMGTGEMNADGLYAAAPGRPLPGLENGEGGIRTHEAG